MSDKFGPWFPFKNPPGFPLVAPLPDAERQEGAVKKPVASVWSGGVDWVVVRHPPKPRWWERLLALTPKGKPTVVATISYPEPAE